MSLSFLFFFFNDPAPSEIYTLSLHDALPIWGLSRTEARISHISRLRAMPPETEMRVIRCPACSCWRTPRSEEHTSELQSLRHLVCRLLLEKKKKKNEKSKTMTQNIDKTDRL